MRALIFRQPFYNFLNSTNIFGIACRRCQSTLRTHALPGKRVGLNCIFINYFIIFPDPIGKIWRTAHCDRVARGWDWA